MGFWAILALARLVAAVWSLLYYAIAVSSILETKTPRRDLTRPAGRRLPEHLLSRVLKKPLVKLRVVVGLGPGVVPNTRVNSEPHVAAAAAQCINHLLAHFELDHVIFRTVKGPHGNVLELRGEVRETAATNGGDGGEQLRVSRRQPPPTYAVDAGRRRQLTWLIFHAIISSEEHVRTGE